MGTLGRRLGGLAIVVVLVLPAATANTAHARLRQQPCGVGSSLPAPATPRPHYALSVHILPGLRTASGAVAVTFTAPTERGTDRLVLRLWPNGARYARTGAHLFVSRVREGPRLLPVSYPNPTTLAIARPVAAGEQVVVSMNWRLILPRERGLRMKGRGRSVRLGSFFPLLAGDGKAWPLEPPRRPAAEAWTTPTADFDVRGSHPAGLRVLASGHAVGRGRWHAEAVRDFALALGHFKIVTGTAHVPAPVRVTAAVEAGPGGQPARAFLRSAIASLERYSALYAPYPWKTYTVAAMTDRKPGYEYPTLVYQPASDANVAHETAHQWFYSLVGNDQGRDPWLDEGLATWAQTELDPGSKQYFLGARVGAAAKRRLGAPMTFW